MTDHAPVPAVTVALADQILELLASHGEPIRSDDLANHFPVPASAVRDALDYLRTTGRVTEEDLDAVSSEGGI